MTQSGKETHNNLKLRKEVTYEGYERILGGNFSLQARGLVNSLVTQGATFLGEWEQRTKSALDEEIVASQTQSDSRLKKTSYLNICLIQTSAEKLTFNEQFEGIVRQIKRVSMD